jgi:hypothetical protein
MTEKSRPGEKAASPTTTDTSIALGEQTALHLDGVPVVEHPINPFFVHDAVRVILNAVDTGVSITADDLHTAGIGRPEKANSVGSIFAQLHKSGQIERIGHCGSRRSGRNGSVVGFWRKGGKR